MDYIFSTFMLYISANSVTHRMNLISVFIDWHKCHLKLLPEWERIERSAADPIEVQILWIFWALCDTKGSAAPDAAAIVHGCGRSLSVIFLSLRKPWRLQDRRLCCRACPSPRRRVSTLRSSWRLCAGTPSACRTPAPDYRHSTPSCRWRTHR